MTEAGLPGRLNAFLHKVIGKFLTSFQTYIPWIALHDDNALRDLFRRNLRGSRANFLGEPDRLTLSVLENFSRFHPRTISRDTGIVWSISSIHWMGRRWEQKLIEHEVEPLAEFEADLANGSAVRKAKFLVQFDAGVIG
jgi:hypothetical protein